jgi:hypothetical protein
MKNSDNNPFIFYLTFEENLPGTFYIFHKMFKELDFILVPVHIDQLQKLVSFAEQEQVVVIASVVDSRDMKIYNEKVRGLLKYILKSKRLSFMHLSSFSKLNDSKFYTLNKNYYFMKYPLNTRTLAEKIVRFYELKTENNIRWPGGRRAKLGATV